MKRPEETVFMLQCTVDCNTTETCYMLMFIVKGISGSSFKLHTFL